jgi:hypothetical protein
VPPGCAGDDLDLSKVFAQGNCVVVEATESPGAPQLALELSPSPLDVTPGATAKIDVVLRNVSGAELALDLQIPCEPALAFPITIATGSGDQAVASGDPAVEDARTGTACETTQIVRVGLPPSGRARMPLSLRACEQGAGDPCGLPAGQHPLAVKVPLPRVRPAPGVLRVTAP